MSAIVAQPSGTPSIAVALVSTFESVLGEYLASHASMLVEIHPDLALLADSVTAAVLGGGKRLRPSFAYWGWRSACPDGADGEADLMRAAASLELLHACALVHDDVMDASETRRGQPAAHMRFGQIHRSNRWPGSAEAFGAASAILVGDLLLSWAEEMFTAAISLLPPARATAAEHQFDLMRTEVVAGQFLDILAQTRGQFSSDEALRVVQYKTSKYTVERPLLLGAAAAGASERTSLTLSRYGLALGEAFQLRDDLLGVFGDPSETGKPAGDDLREGKRTLLVALAAESADLIQQKVLNCGIGDPDLTEDGVAELRSVLVSTGARDAVEQRIHLRAAEAAEHLDDSVRPTAQSALLKLANAAAHRTF